MRWESTHVLAIHTITLERIVAINGTCGFAFVGCVDSEGTSRELTLYAAATPIARGIEVKVYGRIVCWKLLTLYAERTYRARRAQTLK